MLCAVALLTSSPRPPSRLPSRPQPRALPPIARSPRVWGAAEAAEIPAGATAEEIITASLDRHARRLQKLAAPPELDLLHLPTATAADWRRVLDALAPFMKERRLRRLVQAVRARRAGLHLVVENVADPWNSASLLRTAEALGVQHIHVVESVCEFQLPVDVAHAASRGALGRTDTGEGAARWLALHKYRTSREALEALRGLGLRVFVSDCPTAEDESASREPGHEGNAWHTTKRAVRERPALPIDALDFAACSAGGAGGARGVALVFGNERRGCSRVFTEGGDHTFFLPMCGFTQSFNIGVAVAMSLSAAVASGAFPEGALGEDEGVELLARWCMRDIKAARTLLLQAGLEFADF